MHQNNHQHGASYGVLFSFCGDRYTHRTQRAMQNLKYNTLKLHNKRLKKSALWVRNIARRLLRRPCRAGKFPYARAVIFRVLPLGMIFVLTAPVVRIVTNISSPGKIPLRGMRNIARPLLCRTAHLDTLGSHCSQRGTSLREKRSLTVFSSLSVPVCRSGQYLY